MTLSRIARAGRFRPESLFRPQSVAVVAAGTPVGERMMRNLLRAGFTGAVLPVQAGTVAVAGVLAYPDVAQLPTAPDLAIICDERAADEALFASLASRGTYAALMTGPSARPAGWLREMAERTGVRSYGPGSFGIAVPSIGLDATLGHIPARQGRLALVSQSASLCRVIMDWAAPNGVGFSYIVGVGANDDLGFSFALDWISRDTATGAVLLDVRRLESPRMFLSAARAAARLRPVVAIRPGGRIADPGGTEDATLAAALQRVGVLPVETLDDLLAAAETLTHAKPATGETVAIVGNALDPARLAADAAVRDGLALAHWADLTSVPADGFAEAVGQAAKTGNVGGVLVMHAPDGAADETAIEAVAATAKTIRPPVVVCAMGEQTGSGLRAILARAGVPAFATPETAVRALLHLVQHRRNRAAARELPSKAVLTIDPDRAIVDAVLARGAGPLARADVDALLAAYGMTGDIPAQAGGIRIDADVDPVFGPRMAIAPYFAQSGPAVVLDLPPLNLPLAHAMIGRSGAASWATGADREWLADRLVRVSDMLVDLRRIAGLSLDPFSPNDASVWLTDAGEAIVPLALPPYPSDLVETLDIAGEALVVRPIRPEDADAHAAFFGRLTPEDIRFRFFAAVRAVPAEEIVRMTQIDYDREMAFIAVRPATGETLGAARAVCVTLSREGEFAVVVRPDMKGRGLATHLMRRLAAWARSQDMTALIGQILADNAPMLAFVRHLGFTVRRLPDDPEVMEARLAL